jgi:hypothetical protein
MWCHCVGGAQGVLRISFWRVLGHLLQAVANEALTRCRMSEASAQLMLYMVGALLAGLVRASNSYGTETVRRDLNHCGD